MKPHPVSRANDNFVDVVCCFLFGGSSYLLAALACGVSLGLSSCAQATPVATPNAPEKHAPAPQMGFGGLGFGQGGINPENQLITLDEAVGLTPEQRVKARVILEKEAAALNALAPAERFQKGMPFRQAARDDLRELLTPEQQRKQDDIRRAAQVQESGERTFVADFVRSSPGIAARLGAVTSLSYVNSSITVNDDVRLGRYTYRVLGEKSSETLKIYWEKLSASGPMKITKIEASAGTMIPL